MDLAVFQIIIELHMAIETVKVCALEDGVNAMEHVEMDTFLVELVVAGNYKITSYLQKSITFYAKLLCQLLPRLQWRMHIQNPAM